MFLLRAVTCFYSTQHDWLTCERTKEDRTRDARCACIASVISKRLHELGFIEGQPRGFLDFWNDTCAGLYESSRPDPERPQLLRASKLVMHRLSRKPDVQLRLNEELQGVLKSLDDKRKGETTELSSTRSQRAQSSGARCGESRAKMVGFNNSSL